MNNVTREEFEALLLTCQSMTNTAARLIGMFDGLNSRIFSLETELAASRRLLDGVKDAVGLVADGVKNVDGVSGFLYGDVCRKIREAQQPPATATGEPVVIDPAASAAAETNARATEGGAK